MWSCSGGFLENKTEGEESPVSEGSMACTILPSSALPKLKQSNARRALKAVSKTWDRELWKHFSQKSLKSELQTQL